MVVVEDVVGEAIDRLGERLTVRIEPGAWQDPDLLATLLPSARAIVVRNRTQVTRSLLEAGPALEVVARAGAGLDNVDVLAADELGIVVLAATGANAVSVAEHAVAMALALARDLLGHDRRVRLGQWERSPGVELAGKVWGIVGLGATGRATAALAAGIGMEPVGYDPYVRSPVRAGPEERRITVATVTDLDLLLEAATVVSLHLPLTAATQGLVGASFLGKMRPGSYLVNVARGGLVVEEELAAALDSGRLAGAALDVRAQEPPRLGILDQHERVVLTPHTAGLTGAAQERVVGMIVDDIVRVLGGGNAEHAVGAHLAPAGTPGRRAPLAEGR
ncbi:MAG: hydroxyacid dehydrogenase, partial [Acidimicrobiales bacterium]